MIRRAFLLLSATAAGSAPAVAQTSAAPAPAPAVSALKGHDSNAPVDVEADRIEVQDRADRAVFSGNVHAVQGDLQMDAPRVTVAYSGGAGGTQIQRLDASGGVKVTSPTETATGQFAIYDLTKRLITMLGGVVKAATAAAEPELDPPGVRLRFHGLRVTGGSKLANAVVTVLPRKTTPA